MRVTTTKETIIVIAIICLIFGAILGAASGYTKGALDTIKLEVEILRGAGVNIDLPPEIIYEGITRYKNQIGCVIEKNNLNEMSINFNSSFKDMEK